MRNTDNNWSGLGFQNWYIMNVSLLAQVSSMEQLFKEMGLGPPYVVVEKPYISHRYQLLTRKFEKYMARKNKDETPT